jgi:hypothetical protein
MLENHCIVVVIWRLAEKDIVMEISDDTYYLNQETRISVLRLVNLLFQLDAVCKPCSLS